MNKDAGNFANVELLTAYCDGILEGHEASEKLSAAAMEDRLESVMYLFVHLADKDMFEELYRHSLAKRLLNKKTKSMELEKMNGLLLRLISRRVKQRRRARRGVRR